MLQFKWDLYKNKAVLWCAPGRGAPGRSGAVRSQFSPQPGRWGGAKPFCAPAGALGRGEAILRPELGRWGGALMYFGPSGAPHAPGRCQRPGAHVPPQ